MIANTIPLGIVQKQVQRTVGSCSVKPWPFFETPAEPQTLGSRTTGAARYGWPSFVGLFWRLWLAQDRCGLGGIDSIPADGGHLTAHRRTGSIWRLSARLPRSAGRFRPRPVMASDPWPPRMRVPASLPRRIWAETVLAAPAKTEPAPDGRPRKSHCRGECPTRCPVQGPLRGPRPYALAQAASDRIPRAALSGKQTLPREPAVARHARLTAHPSDTCQKSRVDSSVTRQPSRMQAAR